MILRIGLILLLINYKVFGFAQNIVFPIDSTKQVVTFKNTYLNNYKRQIYKVKNWIAVKFNVDYGKIKVRDNNNIKFVNVCPIYANADSMVIAGELNYVIDFKFDSTNYSISLRDFKIIFNQSPDTLALESLLHKSDLTANDNFILFQIYNHSLNLLKDYELFNKTNLLNDNPKHISYNRFTNEPVSRLHRAASAFAGILLGGIFGAIGGGFIGASVAPDYYLMGYIFIGGSLGLFTGMVCGVMISQIPYKSGKQALNQFNSSNNISLAKLYFNTKCHKPLNLQIGINQRGLSFCLNF